MVDGSVRWEIEEYRFVVAHAKGVDTVVCFMDTGGKWLTMYVIFMFRFSALCSEFGSSVEGKNITARIIMRSINRPNI